MIELRRDTCPPCQFLPEPEQVVAHRVAVPVAKINGICIAKAERQLALVDAYRQVGAEVFRQRRFAAHPCTVNRKIAPDDEYNPRGAQLALDYRIEFLTARQCVIEPDGIAMILDGLG